MTKRVVYTRCGPVTVVAFEAEFIRTPTTYNVDCELCGWGGFFPGLHDVGMAELMALAHAKGHEENDGGENDRGTG